MPTAQRIPVYLEIGRKRVFAGAVDWPGWCRSGRDEDAALRALLDYAPRYSRAISSARLGFRPPTEIISFHIGERLKGDATTDFGAPGAYPTVDAEPLEGTELRRQVALLRACWRAFDGAARKASGRPLRLGPRGGGRSLAKILDHTAESEAAYLSRLGASAKLPRGLTPAALKDHRGRVVESLSASARGEYPARGPRGGVRWTARTFVRRAAWHLLDHAWEIGDRVE